MKFLNQNNLAAKINSDYSGLPVHAVNTISFVKKKANRSLIFVWLITAIICCLLFTLNRSADIDNISSFNNLNENPDHDGLFNKKADSRKINANPSEAFVFVNINKKYIITRYPSNQVPETNLTTKDFTQKTEPFNNSAKVTRVIRRLNPVAKKPTEDFSIKSTPQ